MAEELNIRESLSRYIKFILRNKFIVIGSCVIAVVFVILFQKYKTAYYETTAICISGISKYERVEYEEELLQRTAIDLINHLQLNVENQDYRELANLLGIDISIAYNIKKFEAEQLFQQDMNEDFYTLNKFEVLLRVYDNTIIKDLQEGLIYYFNNNKYIRHYYNRFIEANQKIIQDIDSEMQLLENLRMESSKFGIDISSVSIDVLKQNNKSKISNQVVSLSNFREKVLTHQELLKPLVFVKDFSIVDSKEDDLLVGSIIGGLIGLFVGLFIAFAKEVSK